MDPMTMMSIGQSVMGYMAQKRQAAADEARYQQNRIAATTARDLKIQSLNRRAIQESESITGQKIDLAIKALETRESQVVAAGEAGVAGQTVKLQQDKTEARKLRGDMIYNAQIGGILQQIEDEKAGADAQAMSRINSMARGQEPSMMGAVLGAASSAYSTELQIAGRGEGSFLEGIGLGGAPIGGADPKSKTNFIIRQATPEMMPTW